MSDCYVHIGLCGICYFCCIVGHSLGVLMDLKIEILNIFHHRSFLQLLQKVQVSG